MPAISKLTDDQAFTWATKNVSAHSKNFSRAFAEHFGLSRAGAAPFIRKIEGRGIIMRTGSVTRPIFLPGPNRLLLHNYALPGIDESEIWERDIAPSLNLPPNVANIVHFALTEMVNNANDHSNGSRIWVYFSVTVQSVTVVISDNGIGTFRKIAEALNLSDYRLALLELAKGKFTTDSSQHSGEGIFFTSRAMDLFELHANDLVYRHRRPLADFREIEELQESNRTHGTLVGMAIMIDSPTNLKDVFDHYTANAPDDMTFSKTVIPVRLARVGNEHLLSRSQAKRVLARVDQFKNVQLDFADVPEIGQAFADEIFRVFTLAHPGIVLEAINANLDVQRMIKRAQLTKVQGV